MLSGFLLIAAIAGVILAKRQGYALPELYTKLALAVLAMGFVVSIVEMRGKADGITVLNRPENGEDAAEEKLELGMEDTWKEISVHVSARELTENEVRKKLKEAEEEMRETFLGENPSLDAVTKNLSIQNAYCEGDVKASWNFEPYELVDLDGKLHLEKLEKPTVVSAQCKLSCQKETQIIEFSFQVVLPEEDTEEGFAYYLERELTNADGANATSEEISLPEMVAGREVAFRPKKKHLGVEMSLFGFFVGIAVIVGTKQDKRKQEKERQEELSADYPDILSKLSLYVGAGFSVKAAFEQIARQYRADRQAGRCPAKAGYEGVLLLVNEIADGKGELEAYEGFGVRMRHKSYRKLSLILSQNLRKGGRELIMQLEKEEENAFEERKSKAKIAGEEASTKMLLPMMGLLGVVLIVLIVPALQSIQM